MQYAWNPFGSPEDDDPCAGLSEEECRELSASVDVTFVMAALGCTEDDMREVLRILADAFMNEEIVETEYECSNGAKIRLRIDGGNISVETDPSISDILKDSGGGGISDGDSGTYW